MSDWREEARRRIEAVGILTFSQALPKAEALAVGDVVRLAQITLPRALDELDKLSAERDRYWNLAVEAVELMARTLDDCFTPSDDGARCDDCGVQLREFVEAFRAEKESRDV